MNSVIFLSHIIMMLQASKTIQSRLLQPMDRNWAWRIKFSASDMLVIFSVWAILNYPSSARATCTWSQPTTSILSERWTKYTNVWGKENAQMVKCFQIRQKIMLTTTQVIYRPQHLSVALLFNMQRGTGGKTQRRCGSRKRTAKVGTHR